MEPIDRMKGDDLPVSAFVGREDGTFPAGTSAYEKRGIAVNVPEWQADNCIQCNQCSYVCPHAAIRPFLLTDEEEVNAPDGTKTIQGIPGALKQYKFKMALALTDIGSINYKNSEKTEYDANGNINALEFETKDIDQVLEDNYTGITTTGDQKIQLPTALQIMTDYYIGQKWYVGLHTSLSMRKSASGITNNLIQNFLFQL